MDLMVLVVDLLWICGAATLLFDLIHEIKKSQKELGSLNCQYLSLSTETWLVLVVITSGSGWMILFSRFLEFPHSWFIAVVFIIGFRLVFSIKQTMPIILDLGMSLILQWILSWGPFGWKWAFSLIFTLIVTIFYNGYFGHHFTEYMRLKKENPGSRTITSLVYPLSPILLGASLFNIYFVNGCLLLIAWFYPWNDWFYQFYQNTVGLILLKQSLIFYASYEELCLKGEGLTTQKR